MTTMMNQYKTTSNNKQGHGHQRQNKGPTRPDRPRPSRWRVGVGREPLELGLLEVLHLLLQLPAEDQLQVVPGTAPIARGEEILRGEPR